LDIREDVLTPPIPNIVPDFAHHIGDEVLHFLGTIWHHAQALLVDYGKDLALSYPARVHSNIGH
jgi:23S rRNA A1618 N6-methylase RlmF